MPLGVVVPTGTAGAGPIIGRSREFPETFVGIRERRRMTSQAATGIAVNRLRVMQRRYMVVVPRGLMPGQVFALAGAGDVEIAQLSQDFASATVYRQSRISRR